MQKYVREARASELARSPGRELKGEEDLGAARRDGGENKNGV